jgi:hypothetical protein
MKKIIFFCSAIFSCLLAHAQNAALKSNGQEG